MLVNLVAILFILIGIIGLILPIIPGILMITVGILLLYKNRHEEINKYINEKAPPALADFYNNFLHKITVPPNYVGIDWHHVREATLKSEKIGGSGNGRGDNIRKELDECIRKARSLCVPRYVYIEKKITAIRDDSIEIEGGIKFHTKKVTSYISGASHLVLFVVTIGSDIETEAGLLTSGPDPLKGYLLDRVGSFAVESLAQNLENKLRKDYSHTKNSVSSRFSPGYCDWPIEDQFDMAKVIDFSKAGVSLTEGCMMVPKISISAIVAVAGEEVFKKFVTACDVCQMQECSYRRSA